MNKKKIILRILLCTSLIFFGCSRDIIEINLEKSNTPIDFPLIIYPPDNLPSQEKVLLGKYLFYDKNLSVDNSVSCAACHAPLRAFSDVGFQTSRGVHALFGVRNTPTLTNVAYNTSFTWDGKSLSLEDQMLGPLSSHFEMDISDSSLGKTYNALSKNLFDYSKYRTLFKNAYGDSLITIDRIQKAIASFERTIISSYSPYDVYNRGNTNIISASAIRGLQLFKSDRTNCSTCHSGFNFTDQKFHSNGIQQIYKDSGRAIISNNPDDIGKFKTPSLRNVFLTPPYMHDGSFPDLNSVLQNYNSGGKHNATQDSLIRPLHLSDQDANDIIEFLKTLTDSTFINNKAYANPW